MTKKRTGITEAILEHHERNMDKVAPASEADIPFVPGGRRYADDEVEDRILYIRDRALARVVQGIENRDPIETVEMVQRVMDKNFDIQKKHVESVRHRTGQPDQTFRLVFDDSAVAPAADRALRECSICSGEYLANVDKDGVFGTLSEPFLCPVCLRTLAERAVGE